ncbi:MAG: glycosyltransferase [Dermatophilaceae bacterium]
MAWPTAMFGIVMPRHIRHRLVAHRTAYGRPDLVIYEGSNVGAGAAAAEVGARSVPFTVSLAPPEFFLEHQDVHETGSTSEDGGRRLGLRAVNTGNGDPQLAAEQRARVLIDRQLADAGWSVQDKKNLNLFASDGVACREVVMKAGHGRADYMLYVGTVAFGAVDTLLPLAPGVRRGLRAGPRGSAPRPTSPPSARSPNVRVERYVHQPSVLDDIDVAIHHGGTGTLLACLAVGVPQVVTPQGGHQFMNADQLARLDLGVVVHNDAPEGSVAAAVRRALSNEPPARPGRRYLCGDRRYAVPGRRDRTLTHR